jgi:NADH dehydrogenase FAD-containing subunit
MTDQSGRRRVVIVGGGFAGLFAARRLKRSNVSVTLIDRAQHHVFQPLLYQCATGILSEGKIAAPLRDLLKKYKNVDCVMAEVIDFDAAGRRVIAVRVMVRDHAGEQTRYDIGTVLWTAGVEALPLAAALAKATGAKRDKAGRILVEEDLTIPGHPEISVLGDMMSLAKLPGVAEVAMQSGLYAGDRDVARRLRSSGIGRDTRCTAGGAG